MKEIFYDWGGLNTWLLHAINQWHGDVLDAVMQLGTALGDHDWFALYLAAFALVALLQVTRGAEPRRWLSVLAVFSVAYVLDGVVVGSLKHALDLPRPLAALGPYAVTVVGEPEYRHSFPSGHAVFAATIVASLWPLLERIGRSIAVCFVLWVTLSRVNLGAHFPADVIGGVLLALVIVLGIRLALDALMRKFTKRGAT